MSKNAPSSDQIVVVSHVGRDLLQSAAVFKHERLVVWEYVSNGLQYRDPEAPPIVRVLIDHRAKSITVADNGRGMSWTDLKNFFVMHGENIDRKQGRPGRGFFGTGKAAAFGIAGCLRVTTVKGGRRSRVELRRSAVEAMSSTDPIPVSTIERERATDEKNGTVVEIDQIHLRKIDQADIVHFIERHIAKWPNATVYVNNHLCEYTEPPVSRIVRFRPEGTMRDSLGETELVIKISKTPLDDEQQGIVILSNGVWHETTLAGSERKEMANYIFGELDVPALSTDASPIAAFDLSRSMQLNRSNELVQKIFGFIGFHVEAVRRELVEEERKRRASEEAKQLAREASQIAKIINEDFMAYKARISRARAQASGRIDIHTSTESEPPRDDETDFIFGDEEPAIEVSPTGSPGTNEGGEGGSRADLLQLTPQVEPTPTGEMKGKRAPRNPNRSHNRGGFDVKFANMGETEKRAKYDGDSRTIYINLDHAQIRAALGSGGIDDIAFRRLAYEVAFSEYAVAVAYEMVKANYFLDLYEPITEIRETVNRVALAAADLYATTN